MPNVESIAQPTIQNIRDRNRAEQLRSHAIATVMEHLEVLYVRAVIDPKRAASVEQRRHDSARLVDTVLALTKPQAGE